MCENRWFEMGVLAVALTVPAVMIPSVAEARAPRVSQIPNGSVKGCGNCHVNPAGGGARNPFGTEIENNFLSVPGASGVVLWGPALAALNSDGDSKSNGAELQDPTGAWAIGGAQPGNPALVTNPGAADPKPVPAIPAAAAVGLAAALGALGARAARRRAARAAK